MARDTDKPADTEKGDGEPTTSTSATDASTTQGNPAAGAKPNDPQRVVIEQAPAEPAVYYGEGGVQPAPRKPVKADYKPFEW